MPKERLSKLQKWILQKIYNKITLISKGIKEYLNKNPNVTFSRRTWWRKKVEPHKDKLTTSERVTIHRTLENMLQKGLIDKGKYENYFLTKKGFETFVNANKIHTVEDKVSFKKYLKELRELEKGLDESNARNSAMGALLAWEKCVARLPQVNPR